MHLTFIKYIHYLLKKIIVFRSQSYHNNFADDDKYIVFKLNYNETFVMTGLVYIKSYVSAVFFYTGETGRHLKI